MKHNKVTIRSVLILTTIYIVSFFPLLLSAQETPDPYDWWEDEFILNNDSSNNNEEKSSDETNVTEGGNTTVLGGGGGNGETTNSSGGITGSLNSGPISSSAGFGAVKTSDDVSFLTKLPFIGEAASLSQLVNALFILTLVLGALLAVVKLSIAGATYMLSDVVTKKQDALASIRGAILGLLLIMSTYLLLTQINPDITASGSISLPSITVSDTDDYDEDIINKLCKEGNCIKIECQENINECKQKCAESASDYGANNVHSNYKTGLCVIKTQSEEQAKEACESDAVGGIYYRFIGKKYCQLPTDTSNINIVNNPDDVKKFIEEKENYSKLVELDTGYYTVELDDGFKEDILEECRDIHTGNHVEFFELEEDGRTAAVCFGGSS